MKKVYFNKMLIFLRKLKQNFMQLTKPIFRLHSHNTFFFIAGHAGIAVIRSQMAGGIRRSSVSLCLRDMLSPGVVSFKILHFLSNSVKQKKIQIINSIGLA